MLNNDASISIKKWAKKIAKKQKKYKQLLGSTMSIEFSELPTQHLVVCNAGLVSGTSQESLVELFSQYGDIEDVVMFSGKSFSFVTYKNATCAEAAHAAVNGRIRLTKCDGVLYLLYTKSVPKVEHPFDFTIRPHGLCVITDIVSEAEEEKLLKFVDWSQCEPGYSMKHRRVKHYGYKFRYDNNNVDKESPLPGGLPPDCDFLWERLMARGVFLPWSPDQLTVNQYQPGQGIPPHIDTHSAFEDPIFSLSLESNIVMEFRNGDEGHVYNVLLPQRSILIMSGEARYAWSHGIRQRKLDIVEGTGVLKRRVRTSFTFRRVRRTSVCACLFPQCCDSQYSSSVPDQKAARLELLHVHQVYNEIAGHFSQTRHKPWPGVVSFIEAIEPGSILIDVGCGNGKYFQHEANRFQLGCDRSSGLASLCSGRGFETVVCDCLALPYRADSANAVISIAVIHHLASRQRRLHALKEICRVLRPAGRALVYVWARDQAKDSSMSSYLRQDRRNRYEDGLDGLESQVGGCVDGATKCALDPSSSKVLLNVSNQQKAAAGNSVCCSSKNTWLSGSNDSDYCRHKKNSQNTLHDDVVEVSSSNTGDQTKSTDPRHCSLLFSDTTTDSARSSDEVNLYSGIHLPIHKNRTQFKHQDVLVPWKLKPNNKRNARTKDNSTAFLRYYHVFEEGELEGMCHELDSARVIESFYDQGNWCVVLERT